MNWWKCWKIHWPHLKKYTTVSIRKNTWFWLALGVPCLTTTVEAVWANTLISGQLYIRPPWQNPVWTLAHTLLICTNSTQQMYTFPQVASSSCRHFFCFPRVSAYGIGAFTVQSCNYYYYLQSESCTCMYMTVIGQSWMSYFLFNWL